MKNWFINLKLKKKVLYTFSLLIIAVAFVGGVGLYNMSKIQSQVAMMSDNVIPSIDLLLQIDRDLYQALVAQRTMIYTERGAHQFENLLDDYNENTQQAIDRWEQFKSISNEVDIEAFNKYESGRRKWLDYSKTIMTTLERGGDENIQEAIRLSVEGDLLFNESREIINTLTERHEQIAVEKKEEGYSIYNSAVVWVSIGILLTLILIIVANWGITIIIAIPINKAAEVIKKMSVGNLQSRMNLESKDEIGEMGTAMDTLANNLKGFVGEMNKVASGDLSVEWELKDKEDEIAPGLYNILTALRRLLSETKMLVKAALDGNLSVRGNADQFQGGYREIVQGFNDTLNAVIAPLNESADVLNEMAKGNLTERVLGDYTGDHALMKNNINSLGDSLSNLLSEVAQAVGATASSSSEISSSTEQMAAGAQEQSSQTTEIAGAIEEMTKTIMETASNANTAASFAKETSAQAFDGVGKINEAKKGMDRIVSSAGNTGKIIGSLANKTDQIGEIAQVIDDIADQTNLLALNAAIEAARAGEQGRGFAVVADEVRKLAERTTKATKEIAETIRAIQNEAKEADASMIEAKHSVGEGMRLNEEVTVVLNSIMDSTKKVSSEIEQVAAASEEQSSASEQISKNIEAISSVTNEAAAGTQQIARAAEDLNRLTEKLQDLISRFRIDSNDNRSKSDGYSVRKNGKLVSSLYG